MRTGITRDELTECYKKMGFSKTEGTCTFQKDDLRFFHSDNVLVHPVAHILEDIMRTESLLKIEATHSSAMRALIEQLE